MDEKNDEYNPFGPTAKSVEEYASLIGSDLAFLTK
jgi:hypothetical protein